MMKIALDNRSFQKDSLRTVFAKFFRDKELSVKHCNVDELFLHPVLQSKESLSETIVFYADFFEDNVAVKMSFKYLELIEENLTDNSLEYEISIYRDDILPLIENHITPHVVAYITDFQCGESDAYVFKYVSNEIYETTALRGLFDFTKPHFLVTERVRGRTLDYWTMDDRSIEDWRTILFQLIYTLEVFNQIDLRHNDLNLGNILVEENILTNRRLYFIDSSSYFEIPPVKFMAKIFDFDFSSIKGKINTKLLRTCEKYGICNEPNKKFDLFFLLFELYNGISSYLKEHERYGELAFIQDFCLFCTTRDVLEKKYGSPGRLSSQNGNFEPPDNQIKSTSVILKSDFFSSYLKNVPYDESIPFEKSKLPRSI